ncbi:hypothetical protein JQX08_18325 [Pseudomonas sp. UL073]|uniref:Uncharacterized protein n=1 Tax=Zestomonas insulae TaxID=2809017 RepID=A0ABS2IHZ1_9GAMM|nr:hypothetical protein [Pseudomonas insulae]MBM7062676.1 hypothetical protein [Pseudomonas insulae]
MDQEQPPEPVSDEAIRAYMQRQIRSGRVKAAVLVVQNQQAFPEVAAERIVRCFNELESPYLKR